MQIRRWFRNNGLTVLGLILQAIVSTFGSLILAGEAISKSIGISIRLSLIFGNEKLKERRKRLFGEPHLDSNGVREYDSRYDLPRLDLVFGLAKKRMVFSGRALTHVTYFETQLVREAIKREVEVILYILSPDSKLAERDTLNAPTPDFKEQIQQSLKTARYAKASFPEEWRGRFRVFTYDPHPVERIGTYIIVDPETETSDSSNPFDKLPPDYKKGEWVKAERLQVEQPIQGGDISHSKGQISTWKDNDKFVLSQLKEFNASLKNLVEQTD